MNTCEIYAVECLPFTFTLGGSVVEGYSTKLSALIMYVVIVVMGIPYISLKWLFEIFRCFTFDAFLSIEAFMCSTCGWVSKLQ